MGKKSGPEEKVVSLAEIKDMLSARKKEGELDYEQGIALDHASKFSKLAERKSKKMAQELVGMGVKEDIAVKVADLMPADEEDLKLIFSKERFVLDEEEVKKIMGIVASYR
jgi:DNA-directed RNA polymerase subunit F